MRALRVPVAFHMLHQHKCPHSVCSQENQRDKTTSRGSKVYAEENEPNALVFLSSVGLIDLPFAVIAFHTWKEFFRSGIPTRLKQQNQSA